MARNRARRQSITAPGRGVGGSIRAVVLADDLLLISLPGISNGLPGREDLTDAENEVALLAADGMSNVAIARARGTAERTVANQLAAAYRKLGVGGRRGLRARLHRGVG